MNFMKDNEQNENSETQTEKFEPKDSSTPRVTFDVASDEQNKHEKKPTKRRMRETIRDVSVPLGLDAGTHLDDIKIDDLYLWEVENLGKKFEKETPKDFVNTMGGTTYTYKDTEEKEENENPRSNLRASTFIADDARSKHVELMRASLSGNTKVTEYNKLIGESECILADIVRTPESKTSSRAYVRAGPRRELHFYPKTVNAAIVTCGGLCPGLNNCIREITNTLYKIYGIEGKVYGIRGGYRGFYDPALPPIKLTVEMVEDIHHKGGTILASSRGGFDLEKIMAFVKEKKIKQLYVIGGDGTHRGAFKVHEECMRLVS